LSSRGLIAHLRDAHMAGKFEIVKDAKGMIRFCHRLKHSDSKDAYSRS
jgi:hypothetical protein